MEKIPFILRIKKEAHRKIASTQDIIVAEVYKIFGKAVLHGGTAIWRCYSGKRFSDDLDFYFPADSKKTGELFNSLEKKGFKILKKKISGRSVYSELEYERTSVRLEATFQKISGVIADYETADGNIVSIYSLTPEGFIQEKCSTYLKRKKIRDLWDIFFLLKFINNWKEIKKPIGNLIKNYEKPIDEEELKIIIIEGIAPSSNEMINYIRGKWENKNI